MRVGIVSFWFNRGQATIARYLRDALDDIGHETHVLARPTKAHFFRPSYVESHDVWDQPRVTRGSAFDMPVGEYEDWADACRLDAVMLLQNYQFDAVAALRNRGVRTLGWFAWEAFTPAHGPEALRAYDAIYALTPSQQRHYAQIGIEASLVRWGCHPELAGETAPPGDRVTFLVPGGYLSRRKPLPEIVEAFGRVEGDDLRLVIKTQGVHADHPPAHELAGDDPRIAVVDADLPAAEYRALLQRADVLLAPSRWEGLGLHLYEATALGMPIITTDRPPMSEVVVDAHNGLLVSSAESDAPTPSGVPAYDPDIDDLAGAIARCREPALRARLGVGARERAAELDWRFTVADIARLLGA
jgi:1,2-diacylglycerol 3-alpha-glucosyltransferase